MIPAAWSAGAPLLAAYSTPQGRVIALLHLLPHSSGVIALLPREILLPTLQQLRKFVLRAKVKIEDLSEQYGVVGQHGAEALRAAGNPYSRRGGRLCRARRRRRRPREPGIEPVLGHRPCGHPGGARSRRRRPTQRLGAAASRRSAQRIERAWRLADIRAGLPQVYAATRELFIPQMLNLDLIDGISFTKGCYTGQEIVARTQHLGRIKRRMFRLRLPPREAGRLASRCVSPTAAQGV